MPTVVVCLFGGTWFPSSLAAGCNGNHLKNPASTMGEFERLSKLGQRRVSFSVFAKGPTTCFMAVDARSDPRCPVL